MSGNTKAKFSITGNLTKDVSVTTLANGRTSATYTVAVNESYVDRSGATVETTDFFMVKSYGRQALRDAAMLQRGSFIKAEGQLKSWFNAAEGKGGINFIVQSVKPLARCNPAPHEEVPQGAGNSPDAPAENDDWLSDYEATEAAIAAEQAKLNPAGRGRASQP